MFEQAFKNIDDVLWKEDMSGELDYIEQTSWLLFLKYLDDLEAEKVMEAELAGKSYERIIAKRSISGISGRLLKMPKVNLITTTL